MFKDIGILSGIIAIISYVPYVKDILTKKAKPEQASWLIWTVLAGIAFFSQMAKGASQSLWFTGIDSLGAAFIFVLATRYGFKGIKKRDLIALSFAVFGLVCWYITHNALYALLLAIAVDAIGATLTVWKAYKYPHSETYFVWVLICIAGPLAMISIHAWNVTLLLYPFYVTLANLAVVLSIYLGRLKKRQRAYAYARTTLQRPGHLSRMRRN